MKHLAILLFAFTSNLLFAAVPVKWTVETSRFNEMRFEAYHGEALDFEAAFNALGTPLDLSSHSATLYYQTNGMDQAWWSVPGTVSGNVARVTFTPAMDPGAKQIQLFIGLSAGPSNMNYRATARVTFRNSPGATPNKIEPPVVELDFDRITLRNEKWYRKDVVDDATNATLTAAKDYTDGATNETLTAATDYTDTVAAKKQDRLPYATNAIPASAIANAPWLTSFTETDPTVSDWAKAATPPEGMTANAAVLTNGYLKTKSGTSITAANVGAVAAGFNNNVSFDLANAFLAGGTTASFSPQGIGISGSSANVTNWNWLTSVYRGQEYGLGDWLHANFASADAVLAGITTNDVKDIVSYVSVTNGGAKSYADATFYPKSLGEAWSTYWDGDDVRVTVTNYDSSANLPSLYLEQRTNETSLATNLFKTVWREMSHWEKFLGTNWNWSSSWSGFSSWSASLQDELTAKADRAWGFYDSHTGAYAPDGYTVISSSNVMIAANMSYQKTVTSSAEVWVLTANEPYEPTGISTNGGFQIRDADGNVQFEIIKGDKVTAAAKPFATTVTNATIYVTYNVTAAEHPTAEACFNLASADWKAETAADCPATVSWSGSSGAWVAAVTPKSATSTLFVKASFLRGGDTYINNRCAVGLSQIVLGGVTYNLGTNTISGHTVLTLTPAN